MTNTAVKAHGPAATSEREAPDEREFTSDDDVEIDTITTERMERLRQLADQFARSS